MTIYLSKRAFDISSVFNMNSAIETIQDKVQLFEHPFETLFSVIVPMLPKSFILKSLFFAAEYLGFGPGNIGKFIDNMLGLGTKEALSNVSDINLKEAATGVINKIFELVGIKAQSMVEDIYMIKKSFDINDLIAVSAYIRYNNVKLAKVPISRKMKGKLAKVPISRKMKGLNLLDVFKRENKVSLIGMLYVFLKTFLKGVLGLGIVGGVAGALTKKPDFLGTSSSTGTSGSTQNVFLESMPTDLYLNVNNNVEDTLINYLNSEYKLHQKNSTTYTTFSNMFQELNGYPLKNSNEMQNILTDIERLNFSQILQINNKKTFVGPKLETISKKLIPVMKIENKEEKPVKKELSQISKNKRKESVDEELLKSLRGVYK